MNELFSPEKLVVDVLADPIDGVVTVSLVYGDRMWAYTHPIGDMRRLDDIAREAAEKLSEDAADEVGLPKGKVFEFVFGFLTAQ
jgi:hypothetical protein